jgi:hypothetical protein
MEIAVFGGTGLIGSKVVEVIVDLTNSPIFDEASPAFFRTSMEKPPAAEDVADAVASVAAGPRWGESATSPAPRSSPSTSWAGSPWRPVPTPVTPSSGTTTRECPVSSAGTSSPARRTPVSPPPVTPPGRPSTGHALTTRSPGPFRPCHNGADAVGDMMWWEG